MTFKFLYFKSKKKEGKPVKTSELTGMGNWRSRWERKRDLDNKSPNKNHIDRICTRGTDKDYVVTSVHGRSPDNLYFKAFPISTPNPAKPKKKGYDVVAVKDTNKCKNCGNFIKRLSGLKKSASKQSYHTKRQKTSIKTKKGNFKK